MHSFSSLNREKNLQHLSSQKFDLLIIGGGITGAGIGLDAANRGLKVALIEMQDFAAGTSSRSTKLIHGGLRYLKNFEFGLVREVGRERAIIYRNATHLVKPEKMLLPIYKNGSLGKFATNIALTLYDSLAGVARSERKKMLSVNETLKHEPLLYKAGLLVSALYFEYQVDDSRLVIENLKTAAVYGALCLNYVKASYFIYENEKLIGVKAIEKFSKQTVIIHADYVINAAGPWVDELRKEDHPLEHKRLHLTKGIHIVVDHEQLPLNQAVYFDAEDHRMIFAIPKNNCTYIGTTDTNYAGNIEHPDITKADVDYLLKAANKVFPSANLSTHDIKSAWSGLRPLIHHEGKSPSELSRKDEIFISSSGLISIAGGKLTGYRMMAKRVVDLVMKEFEKEGKKKFVQCKTDKIKLSGGEFESVADFENFLQQKFREGKSLLNRGSESENVIRELFFRYGKNIDLILKNFKSKSSDAANLLEAEMDYCIEFEMTQTPADFLIRRTGKLYFDRIKGLREINFVSNYLKEKLRYTEEQAIELQKECVQLFDDALAFK